MVQIEIDLWLKPEDVEPEGIIVPVAEGEYVQMPTAEGEESRTVLNIPVQLKGGEDRTWTPNKTSIRTVAQVYGKDTKTWIGRQINVYVAVQQVGGQMRKIIYARTPKPQQ